MFPKVLSPDLYINLIYLLPRSSPYNYYLYVKLSLLFAISNRTENMHIKQQKLRQKISYYVIFTFYRTQ